MVLVFSQVPLNTVETLVPVLRDADEDEDRIRALLTDGLHTSYAVHLEGKLIGALSLRWETPVSELEYMALLPAFRGQGYGKVIITYALEQGRLRGLSSLLVGTGNSSWDTIAFYQKCGFRMDSVRPDFFSYIQPPLVEDGIVLRDMLVLRYAFTS